MLTTQQLTTLKASILANTDPTVVQAIADGNAGVIATHYNGLSVPDFFVWRNLVSDSELRAAAFVGATQLDGLTASKRDSLLWAIEQPIDFTVATNRAAIDDFCGSQNTLKAALQAVQKRPSTIGEKLFATGTGSAASPATAVIVGNLSVTDISQALQS